MERLTNLVKEMDFALIAFVALSVRIVVVGAGIGDAVALLGLLGIMGFKHFVYEMKQRPVQEAFLKRINELETKVNILAAKDGLEKVKPGTDRVRYF